MYQLENYIGGKFVCTKKYLNRVNPATGKIIGKVPDSSQQDVNEAVIAARNGFECWSSKSVSERANYLYKLASKFESNINQFTKWESEDQGKPEWLASNVEMPRVALNFRAFAEYYQHHLNDSNYISEAKVVNYTIREPVGVAGLIVPWNLPLYLLTFKMAPALITGNTIVCKPSELTSHTAYQLSKLCHEIGFPPGVINMVYGTGAEAGEALVKHPDVPIISFTGSTNVGKHINTITAPMLKKISLELGGKNAGIIFDDADLSICLPVLMRSCFLNQGEVCLSTSRLFVHRNIWTEFIKKFVEKARELKVGSPKSSETFVGALISETHLQKVQSYIELAKKENATIHCGDEPLILPEENQEGYFIRPTVITDVDNNSRLMKEEIFGPVVCITPFDTEDDVIESANSVPYGLCASVFGQDISRVNRVAHKMQVGTVWINCWLVRSLDMPFGGTKSSGLGREGTRQSLELYTQLKTVAMKI